MIEAGISSGLFYHKDIIGNLDSIKNAGFSHIELWAGAAKWGKDTHFDYNDQEIIHKIKTRLSLLKLDVCSINAPCSALLDISSMDEMQRSIAVAEIKKAITLCEFFKAEYVVVHPCVKTFPLTDIDFVKKKMNLIKKSLRTVVDHAMLHEVKVACENPSPHLFGGWASDLLELIMDYPQQYMGICLDTGHANIITDPSAYLTEISERLFTLHVSDNDGTYSAHLPPGAGNINWDKFAYTLKDIGYKGIFMLEILGGKRFENTSEVLKQVFDTTDKIITTYQKYIPAPADV